MATMAGGAPIIRHTRTRLIRVGVALAAAVLLASLTAVAISPLPMRGAEMFGVLANKIKGNPRATIASSLTAAVGLWVCVALMAAAQEWRARKSRPS
jgi:hypothetical protein